MSRGLGDVYKRQYIYTKELRNLSQPEHGNRINTECGAFLEEVQRPHIYTMLRGKEKVMARLTIKDEQGNWALKGVK